MTIDIAIVEERDGRFTLHTATCSWARNAADAGQPVMTMLDCQSMPDLAEFPELIPHDCLAGLRS